MKLWGGRFKKPTDTQVEVFTASIEFDQQLFAVDIIGSLAHVNMLGSCGLLEQQTVRVLTTGLKNIHRKIKQNKIDFTIGDEDIHMNIERALFKEIGDAAGKLHTGRSRNDQVALDVHLYLREQILVLVNQLLTLKQALMGQATAHTDTLLPGYTHLQRAQPVSFAHHLLAYCAMFERDAARLIDSFKRINTLPLGAGALAGSSHPLDREQVAELLHFDALYENSMDAVSDRDFVIEFMSNAAMIMLHLSRLSEELVLWSSQEFNFITLDESYTTGSSMMPQKKNPDVPELVRGKTGRVFGALMGMLTLLKGLPLTYNKDMQEDKEGLFDTVKTLQGSLSIYAPMIDSMTVNRPKMRAAILSDFSNATRLADYLVNKGLAFRSAHTVVGEIVQYCIEHQCYLADLDLATYQQFYPDCDASLFELLTPEAVVNASQIRGGTAKIAVEQQMEKMAANLSEIKTWLTTQQVKIDASYALLE